MLIDGNGIAPTYTAARATFLSALKLHNAEVYSVEHPDVGGPDGEPLFMDWAILGKKDAQSVFLVTCGTHGIEGYVGSAILSNWLQTPKSCSFDHIKIVLVHAVNPWGFAHQQRVNENNVDLNRNFIAFDRIPDNHGYHELHPSLMLDEWSDAAFETAFDSMDAFRHRHGEKAFSDAFNGGQYAHDDGIFFGGREPQWSNRVFRKMLHEAIGPLADVHFLDIHTGIGAYGRPFHINFDKPGTRSRMLTEAVWGSDVFSNKESTHTAFASYQGLLMDAVVDELQSRSVSRCVVEFGTYTRPRMQRAHLGLAWSRLQENQNTDTFRQARKEYCEAFVPSDADWRKQVVELGSELCRDAVQKISALLRTN